MPMMTRVAFWERVHRAFPATVSHNDSRPGFGAATDNHQMSAAQHYQNTSPVLNLPGHSLMRLGGESHEIVQGGRKTCEGNWLYNCQRPLRPNQSSKSREERLADFFANMKLAFIFQNSSPK
jgi:hypothetical protein